MLKKAIEELPELRTGGGFHFTFVFTYANLVCAFCEEDRETFYHFVTDCPRLRTLRTDYNLESFDRESWTQKAFWNSQEFQL